MCPKYPNLKKKKSSRCFGNSEISADFFTSAPDNRRAPDITQDLRGFRCGDSGRCILEASVADHDDNEKKSHGESLRKVEVTASPLWSSARTRREAGSECLVSKWNVRLAYTEARPKVPNQTQLCAICRLQKSEHGKRCCITGAVKRLSSHTIFPWIIMFVHQISW